MKYTPVTVKNRDIDPMVYRWLPVNVPRECYAVYRNIIPGHVLFTFVAPEDAIIFKIVFGL